MRPILRSILRDKGFSAVVILTMALGMGANTAIFAVVRAVLLRPLPFPNVERIVTVWESDPPSSIELRRLSPANFVDWRSQTQSFEAIGALPNWTGRAWPFKLGGKDGVERVPGIYASSGFFDVLGVAPLLGHTFTTADDQGSQRHAILSYDLWQRRFNGDPAILGKSIPLDTFLGGSFTVTAVMPASFEFPPGAKLWASLADWGAGPMPALGSQDRCCAWYATFARLKPGVTPEHAAAELTTIARRTAQSHPKAPHIENIRIRHLQEYLVGGQRSTLFALLGAVACILLIACANVANLLLSRSVGRSQEMVTRMALGASTGTLARQLIAESLALCALGAATGLMLATWTQSVIVRLFAGRIPLIERSHIDWHVLAFAVAATVVCAVACGLAPLAQWRASNYRSRGQSESRSSRRLRNALICAQVALSVVLMTAAGLMLRTVMNLRSVDFGLPASQLLAVSTDLDVSGLRERGASARMFDTLLPRLAALPGVTAVGVANPLPLENAALSPITREGAPRRLAADSPQVSQSAVTPGYFAAAGIPLLRGRLIADSDTAAARDIAVLSETAARRYWPGEDPIGKRFALGSLERIGGRRPPNGPETVEYREVVGVVGDVRTAGYKADRLPQVYYSYKQYPIYDATVLVRTSGDPMSLASVVRGEIRAASTAAAIKQIRTIDQIVADAIAEPRIRAGLLAIFAALAVLLGALGIYSVASYTVSRRVREIGIRMALGANPAEVARLIIRQMCGVAAIGAILGLLGSLAVGRLLVSFLFGVPSSDPLTLAASCTLLLGAVIAASYLPARRSSKIDPAIALRND